jgi:hypothetical protein
MAGGGSLLPTAAPAGAAEVSFATECIPPPISGLPPVEGTTKADIRAPATAKVGDEITVVWKTVQAASKNPDVLDLKADTVKPTGRITVGGAQSGTLAVEGERKNPPIPKNSDMKLSDMKATIKLTKAGEVTLTPGGYNINVSQPISTDTKCTPTEHVTGGATVEVTDGGGTTASGGTTTSGGTTASGGTTSGGTTSGGTASGGTVGGGTTSGGTSGGTASGGTSSGTTASGGTGGGSTGSTGGSTGGSGDPDGTEYKGKEVSVDYACKTPIGDKRATSGVTVNAVSNKGNYDLTVHFGKSVMDSPADIPANSVKPGMRVKVGGAETGEVGVEGPLNPGPIKAGDPIEIPDLKGLYKPGRTGKVTLTPGVLTVKALGTTTTCTPEKDPGASLRLEVKGQSGGVAGGTSSGTSSGGTTSSGGVSTSGASTSGGLPNTGAGNIGSVRALGLMAGTLLLVGGAVFAFTPWRRLRR